METRSSRATSRPGLRTAFLLVALGLLATAAPLRAQTARPAPTGETGQAGAPLVAPATVVIWNRPIVVFRVPINAITPAARAAAVVQRFAALPDDVRADEITAVPATVGDLQGVVVGARGQVLFGILGGDVDPTAGETLDRVSERAVAQLRTAVEARIEQRRPAVIARGIAISVGAAILLVLILWGIARAADRALIRVAEATGRRAVSMLGVDVRRPLEALERGLVKVTAWALGLVALYLWLTISLHAFPYTRPWATQLRADLLDRLQELGIGALQSLPGLFAVVVIFLSARFAIRILDVFFEAVERDAVKVRTLAPDTARATRQIATALIWIFALTVAYGYIPASDTNAFKAIGVLVGLMISLGSAGLVNQFMSGLMVVYSRGFRPGEFVRVGEHVGRVSEVRLLATKLVAKGTEITIPNAVVVGTTVTNYSRLGGSNGPVLSTAVGIGYDAPWRQVHGMLKLAAGRTDGIRAHPAPLVLQQALSDHFVDYELRVHLETGVDPVQVRSDLHSQIQDAFNEFGVQIMSPSFEGQPDHPVVVPRSRWFESPAAPAGDGAPPPKAS